MNVPTLGLCSHAGLWRSATEKSGCALTIVRLLEVLLLQVAKTKNYS